MPAPSNDSAPALPVSALTNVKIKKAGADPNSSSNRLDASTLELSVGSNRVYVDGLPDSGAGAVDGITMTVSCSFLTSEAPTAGNTYEIEGVACKCTEAEVEHTVGELVKGTATFVSVPPEEV
jgi:hypothetical protein